MSVFNSTSPTIIIKSFAILAITGLFFGFFFNRVVYSCGAFFAALYVVSQSNWYNVVWQKKYIGTFALLSLVILLADIIHNGADAFGFSTFYTKLLLLLFPLFIHFWTPSGKQVKLVHAYLYLLLMVNVIYSLYHYMIDKATIDILYGQAKVLPVLALQDHIRLSWLYVVAIWLVVYDFKATALTYYRVILLVLALLFVVYLHILSAKTGLLILYGSVVIHAFYHIFSYKRYKYVLLLIPLFIAPVVAFYTLPSFHKRMSYVNWDITKTLNGEMSSGLSDGSRIYSLKAGADLFKAHPVLGLGLMNLRDSTNNWYKANQKEMKATDYILPSSEFLIYGASAGVLGLAVLFLHLLFPLMMKGVLRHWLFITIYIPSMLTFTYETHLEGQMTLFVYGFFMYWCWSLSDKCVTNTLN